MLIVHRRDGTEREVELDVVRGPMLLADVAELLGERRGGLLLDGIAQAGSLPLSATLLVRGSRLEALPPGTSHDGRPRAPGVGRPETPTPAAAGNRGPGLVVVVGPTAGTSTPLRAAVHVLGRAPDADVVLPSPTVSAHHAELRVDRGGAVAVRDLGSHNGTWLASRAIGVDWVEVSPDSVLRLGAVVIRVELPVADGPSTADPARFADAAGRLVVNRPPRPTSPPGAAEMARPEAPGHEVHRPALALLPAVLAAAIGLVMVAVTGNWLFALFPLLSPLLALSTWSQARRRAGRVGRREATRLAREVGALERHLAGAQQTELVRRRALVPDLPEIVRRIEQPSRRLWERRPEGLGAPPAHAPAAVPAPTPAADWLRLNAGVADVPWTAPLPERRGAVVPAVEALLSASARLVDAPVEVDLSGGGVVGIVGAGPLARAAARALARSFLLQAVALHGPADLAVTVLASAGESAGWRWSHWLPHVEGDLGGGAGALRALLAAQPGEAAPRCRLLVLDDEQLLAGARSPARAVLSGAAGPVAGIVVAGGVDRLPASCTTVIELREADGLALLRRRGEHDHLPVIVGGLTIANATQLARRLARYVDGDQRDAEGGLPRSVGLSELLGSEPGNVDALLGRWGAANGAAALSVPLGVTTEGPLSIDLVADGPHVLVAGTTGSGKSELLRSWVAALAATTDPRQLNFILIDYKGGAAFDACALLPHTVAVVTDLDDALAARALRCLEAELRYREACLRRAGVDDLRALWAAAATGAATTAASTGRPAVAAPARLVVVVDEFATLAAELPDFVDTLVDVAQRGRSLGVHLVLATQRPAGVVNERVRANTALRVALRVQDRQESQDVLGSDAAAGLPRHRPGRAVVRFGPGEMLTMQTALVTGLVAAPTSAPGPEPISAPGPEPISAPAAWAAGRTELAVLVGSARTAAARLCLDPPRCPWPPPLPSRVLLDDLASVPPSAPPWGTPAAGPVPGPAEDGGAADTVALYLADDPDHQTRHRGGWRPGAGNLQVIGGRGSGATTTLATTALALASSHDAAGLHLYVVESVAGPLATLARLPHCGGVVRLGEDERLARLVLRLRSTLDERRSLPPEARQGLPAIVLLVDDWSALQAELDQPNLVALGEALGRVLLEGPTVGMHAAVSVERPGGLRPQLAGSIGQRIVLRLADPIDARSLGLRPQPALVPGRGVVMPAGLEIQVALPGASGLASAVDDVLAGRVQSAGPGGGGPDPLRSLPARVEVSEILAGPSEPPRPSQPSQPSGPPGPPGAGADWYLAVGTGWSTLRPVGWTIHPGEHVLIAGPARSGRTTALCTLAAVVRHTRPEHRVLAVAARRSRLRQAAVDQCFAPDELASLAQRLADGRPTVLLVDDADQLDDGAGILAQLVATPRDDLVVVAAGRNDSLRGQYGTWLRRIRASRAGLLLQPDADVDGDLLGVRLPRRPLVALGPGRGYLVEGGSSEIVQVAATYSPSGS